MEHINDELLVLNHGWNIEIEKMLSELEDKSWGFTWMHKKSVSYFGKLDDRLSITNIIFSLVSGTSTFATLNTCTNLLFIQIGTGIVIYAAALLSAIQHFKGYAERIEKHKQAASKYSALYHSIKKERVVRPEQRQNAKDYITWITNQYDSLLLSSPDIEDDIMNLYVRQYKMESGITVEGDNSKKFGAENNSVVYNPQLADPVERARAFPIDNYEQPQQQQQQQQKPKRRKRKDKHQENVAPSTLAPTPPTETTTIPEIATTASVSALVPTVPTAITAITEVPVLEAEVVAVAVAPALPPTPTRVEDPDDTHSDDHGRHSQRQSQESPHPHSPHSSRNSRSPQSQRSPESQRSPRSPLQRSPVSPLQRSPVSSLQRSPVSQRSPASPLQRSPVSHQSLRKARPGARSSNLKETTNNSLREKEKESRDTLNRMSAETSRQSTLKHSDLVTDLRMRMNSQLSNFNQNAIEYEMERLNRSDF
jgi:hypothetical protein